MTTILLIVAVAVSCVALIADVLGIIYLVKIMPKDNTKKIKKLAKKALIYQEKINVINSAIVKGGSINEK